MFTAQELIGKVKNLPPVPQTALKLVGLLDQPSVSNDEVVALLRCDNVLTAKLLRACNSPYFGLAEPVSSVDQAVFILGHQQILHIVLTISFGSAMVVSLPGYAGEANELWRHSLITATAGEIIADQFTNLNVEPPVAFTVGLLHDIGKLVLNQALTPDLQKEIRTRADRENLSRYEAELAVLGTNHAEVGGCLLQTWHLPEAVVEAAAHHHQPVLKPRPRLSAVTFLADRIAHQADSKPGQAKEGGLVSDEFLKVLPATPDEIADLITTVRESFEKVDHFMNLT